MAASQVTIASMRAAVLATPGCEMRSIPHLIAILRMGDLKEHVCPGPLDRFDEWGAQRRSA